MFQIVHPIWTDNAPMVLVLAIIGCLLYGLGAIFENTIVHRFCSQGLDSYPGLEHIKFYETNFDNSCWNMYSSKVILYQRIVMALKVVGVSICALASFFYLNNFEISIAMATSFAFAMGIYNIIKSRNLREKSFSILKEWHDAVE